MHVSSCVLSLTEELNCFLLIQVGRYLTHMAFCIILNKVNIHFTPLSSREPWSVLSDTRDVKSWWTRHRFWKVFRGVQCSISSSEFYSKEKLCLPLAPVLKTSFCLLTGRDLPVCRLFRKKRLNCLFNTLNLCIEGMVEKTMMFINELVFERKNIILLVQLESEKCTWVARKIWKKDMRNHLEQISKA